MFVIIGLVGFLSGFMFRSLQVLDLFELSMGDLQGIAVDSEGRIYCGLQYFSRVQVYDSEGEFLYNVYTDSSRGAFRIRINENDQLEVATARNDKLYLYDKNGYLINEQSDVGHYFSDFGMTGETRFYDEKEDTTYFRKGHPIYAHVVKRDSTGQENVIIRTPFHKWLFQGPFPAWLFLMIAALINWISKGIKLRRFWPFRQR
jgi:hypothetical protein